MMGARGTGGDFRLRNAWVIAGCYALSAVVVFVVGVAGGAVAPSAASTLVLVLVAAHGAVMLALTVGFLRYWDVGWLELGVRRPTSRLWHVVWQVPLVLVGLVVLQELTFSVFHLGGVDDPTQATSHLGAAGSGTQAVASVLGIVILAPLWEELFFRGYLQEALRRRWNTPVAIIVSGLAFGLVHLTPLLAIYHCALGMVLGWLRSFHGNVWAGLILHMVVNGLVTAATLAA
ncbi:CPBP family intramembrane metalloprotease [Corynebacterium uropygiale]|uniref:CPBP family intramembrane metalloprotease n=1 Tax=Corynebacterium uropygiale TaxID=1775911 RepID=A0A9X1QT56_9CORY|nr:CPBP family intramembrane glutamic endopeptidase [Corynebacterium uropygiale]MCF4007343.1 CPBP family intramembrane metalloprotease [Corynebacterium uropygiale]